MADLGRRTVYSTDNSVHQWLPDAVATPRTATDVVDLVTANARSSTPRALCARGGGTSTNGQSLTDGLVIDTKRFMNRVISVDPVARRAVVEPGVVAGHLDARLAADGLFWAPHTSTRNRATVGGMIATDAAGKGSLVHGRTNRHVEAVDLVLADGTRWSAEPLPLADAMVEADRHDSIGQIWRVLLGLSDAASIGLPELARGFSGYGISRVHHDGLVDPIPVICGAEGTLGIVVRATLRLTPTPVATTLVVASYRRLDDALRDAVWLAGEAPVPGSVPRPSAIEVSDHTTLAQGQSSPAWPSFARHVGADLGAVLLCEYDAPAHGPVVAAVSDAIRTHGRAVHQSIVDSPAERADIWKVRADAVGLLANVPHGSPRPTAFVEDCAVPVTAMPEFIAAFRALLDRHHVDYAMFGHADVGCVHVRPALDPIAREHESLVEELTGEVVELLDRFGGILWGEHGRGLRSSLVTNVLPADTISLMRAVKTAFDPGDLMNPGKLYRPLGAGEPLIGLADVPRRATFDRAVPVSIRSNYSHAFDCNGNGLCHHHDEREVMCPSFKITQDPMQSPKGRTDLIRAWLNAEAQPRPDAAKIAELDQALAASMATCLSCGACTGHCPVHVDVPELKSRFLESYHARNRRPLRDHLLARFEQVLPVLQRLPGRDGPAASWAARRLGLVDLPLIPSAAPGTSASRRFGATGGSDPDVVLLADAFSSVFERDEMEAAVDLLEQLGHRTAVAPLRPTAKFEHVKGMRKRFARAATRQQSLLEEITAVGATAVSIDPAITLLHHHDYAKVAPGYPGASVRPIVELLAERSDSLPRTANPRNVLLFGHCTEQAQAPEWIAQWADILRSVGHDVRVASSGCCGMAGVFGHEAEHADMSRDLYRLSWTPQLGSSAEVWHDVALATGWSCRSQAHRHGDSMQSPLGLLTEDARS